MTENRTEIATWDYYIAYHLLLQAKAKIEEALERMVQEEYGNYDADQAIKKILEPAQARITETLDEELIFPQEEDEETA
ncbi:hypothetical protein [Nostoc sp. MS1]|uniref:hypothetical protein n=1 Tax=Nostoc sp. MS1 TaxID=2764711 RepID=UPI001CC5810C|nr:hypothetical protein [Nostoc sp. MS1]BCL34237.1 hypothetical protein NSMS1_06840 [Nostoc sp. MS1]